MITNFDDFKIYEGNNDGNQLKKLIMIDLANLNLKNLKDYTIKTKGGNITISILSENGLLAKKEIKKVVDKYSNIVRDELTGDILSHSGFIDLEVSNNPYPQFLLDITENFAKKTFNKFKTEIILGNGDSGNYKFDGFEDINISIELYDRKLTIDVDSIGGSKDIFFGYVGDFLKENTDEKMFKTYLNYCKGIFLYVDAVTYLEIKDVLNGSSFDKSIFEKKDENVDENKIPEISAIFKPYTDEIKKILNIK